MPTPTTDATVVAGKRPNVVLLPDRPSPGLFLNALNRFVQLPVVAPLLQGVYWALLCSLSFFVVAPTVLLASYVSAVADLRSAEIERAEANELAIVITGCDSGFGLALARNLAERGYKVFAGCLNPALAAAADASAQSPAPVFLQMDVTSGAEVAAAADEVAAWVGAGARRRLHGVVCNAGVGTGGLVDWLSMDDFERDSAVNYLGTVRVVKAFLPLLKRAATGAPAAPPPRVVIVSSMSGKVAVPLLSSYSASKHAVAAFASSLRMELSHLWGIEVCTALPTFHLTPLLSTSTITKVWTATPPALRAEYGEAMYASWTRVGNEMMRDWAWHPQRVVEQLSRAVTQRGAPPAELTIGSDGIFGLHVMRRLPTSVVELLVWTYTAWNLAPGVPRARTAAAARKQE